MGGGIVRTGITSGAVPRWRTFAAASCSPESSSVAVGAASVHQITCRTTAAAHLRRGLTSPSSPTAVVIWKRICSPSCLCLAASRAAATRPQTVRRRREPMPRPAAALAGAFSGLLVLLLMHALADTATGAISLSKAEVDEFLKQYKEDERK
ncbi:hypothetical protein MTO96_003666 [Rhipicephalus appendiculatus]